MTSNLPITGYCHQCHKHTNNTRFCSGTPCQRLYYYRARHPEVKRIHKHKPQTTVNWTPKGGTIDDRIAAIVARAQPDQMTPGRDIFYRGGLSLKAHKL